MTKKINKNRNAFTLVEVLIVIAIMSFIAALVIPQVRVLNKDRNIRETARVVGSMFNSASERARLEGVAGVLLVKNQNFVDENDDVYAATAMFRLKKVLDFTGVDIPERENIQFQKIMTSGRWFADIRKPLQDGLVQVGDTLTVKREGFEDVRIVSTTEYSDILRMELDKAAMDVSGCTPTDEYDGNNDDVEDFMIIAPTSNGIDLQDMRSWVVERRPRAVESSRIDLPEGYMVDMRYSDFIPGNHDQPGSRFVGWHPDMTTPQDTDVQENSIAVVFNGTGGIEVVGDEEYNFVEKPYGPVYLFVAEAPVDDLDPDAPLNKDNNLWVKIDHKNGTVNVGNNISQAGNTDGYVNRLMNAREIAGSGLATD